MSKHDQSVPLRHMLDHAKEAVSLISLRNRLIHGYNSVDFDILWQIVTADLPALVRSLEHILRSQND